MKAYKLLIFFAITIAFLTSCEHDVSMETTVHEDGHLDKVISLEVTESDRKGILDLTVKKGWTKKANQENKGMISFTKSFASVAEVNKEFAITDDTLFHMTSLFEKRFRWFYTYMYYAETYHAINRMKLPIGDYVTPEDYAFIDRLPSEGKKISKADELYLKKLNEKLFDIYGTRAIYEESYAVLVGLLKEQKVESRWLDSLEKHKEYIFNQVSNEKDLGDDFLIQEMDRCFQIPLPHNELKNEYGLRWKEIERKLQFIIEASEGKYVNRINMPWGVVKTNADSLIGNQLVWKPPVTKLLIKDYTMYAEARKMNYWAVLLSAALIGLTGYLFVRRRTM